MWSTWATPLQLVSTTLFVTSCTLKSQNSHLDDRTAVPWIASTLDLWALDTTTGNRSCRSRQATMLLFILPFFLTPLECVVGLVVGTCWYRDHCISSCQAKVCVCVCVCVGGWVGGCDSVVGPRHVNIRVATVNRYNYSPRSALLYIELMSTRRPNSRTYCSLESFHSLSFVASAPASLGQVLLLAFGAAAGAQQALATGRLV